MAERIQVELVDDIDGSRAQQTVTFGLDGVAYEIDLSERHAQQLRSVFASYIERARTPERTSRTTRQQEREERKARQTNRQLTEQIRGAAQRSRDRMSQQAQAETTSGRKSAQDETSADGPAAQERQKQEESAMLFEQSAASEREQDESAEETRVPAVSLPHFSSAAD